MRRLSRAGAELAREIAATSHHPPSCTVHPPIGIDERLVLARGPRLHLPSTDEIITQLAHLAHTPAVRPRPQVQKRTGGEGG